MGWLWDKIWPSEQPSTDDPLRDLDPSLRQFLEKESPLKYKPAQAAPPPPPAAKEIFNSKPPKGASDEPSKPRVPPQSLFPDGRYAHLWKTYRPLNDIEAEGKSDQEKLQDVIDAYKDRKAMIGQAAIENCSFEEEAIEQCYRHGSYMRRMMLCRPEKQAFNKCYTMQTKFLKALGFMSTWDRKPEVDEHIQMHADKLYHQMLAQETAIEAARNTGAPTPTFTQALPFSTLPSSSSSTSSSSSPVEEEIAPSIPYPPPDPFAPSTPDPYPDLPPMGAEMRAKMHPSKHKAWREKLKGKTPLEIELEERAKLREIEDATVTHDRYREIQKESKKKAVQGTSHRTPLGNWLLRNFGWGDVEEEGTGKGDGIEGDGGKR